MKNFVIIVCFTVFVSIPVFSQTENDIDLSFYASTKGEMQLNFTPQWKFPFLQGSHPLTRENNIVFKLDTSLNPIWMGLTGDSILTIAPFISFRLGAMVGTGWNYNLFGKDHLVGLGMNRKTNINDPANSVAIGNGFDGIVWDVHSGSLLQFDLAAFFPGNWNHVVMQFYNQIDYFAYSKAKGDEFWYYLDDEGMNQNTFRYSFEFFIGYMMPTFVDLIGYQFSGIIPFYNLDTGTNVRERGYSFINAFITYLKIKERHSIMTITRIKNDFTDPEKYGYERKWGFDCIQLIYTWKIK